MRYRDYRRRGYSRFTAFMLSASPLVWYGISALIGLAIGSLPWLF